MEAIEILQKLGLTKKHAEVFIILYKYGTSPASFVGKMIGEERTNTYKILQSLVREGFIAENIKGNVKYFFVANKEVLRVKIQEQKTTIEKQEALLPQIEQVLSEFDKEKVSPIPKMRFFEGNDGIKELFKDIIIETKKKNYSTIKCISSNTLESLSINNKKLEDYAGDFFLELEKSKIKINAHLGTGVLTLEQMMQSYEISDIKNLSVGNNSLNFFIVGEITYLLIFKQIPSGIKLESSEFSDLMHFMIKKIEK